MALADLHGERGHPDRIVTTSGETIVAAAIRRAGCVCSLPRPARHCHVIEHMVTGLGFAPPINRAFGFVTSTGRFVDRFKAAKIAFKAGQTKCRREELFSEDVW